ncbi:unnamed protein product [Cyprideis torosa]|uniref:Uncharacterized protein n=1 Tax=Cyprideis torosa TaxID=163714 RepID=A0A7R8WHI1_9CRUS|nr:unnamed protein product [Cyprideis torosa]CAG0899446.1 unnamed protein product [Cyprideis torosa]
MHPSQRPDRLRGITFALSKFLAGAPKEGPHPKGWRLQTYPVNWGGYITHFPMRHYYENSWMLRYFLVSACFTLILMHKITNLSYSPENVKKFAELRKSWADEAEKHWK